MNDFQNISDLEIGFTEQQLDVVLNIMAKNQPQEAIQKLSDYLAMETNSDEIAIYYTRRVNGDPSLVQLPFANNILGDDTKHLEFEHRPILEGQGICEWVLKNNTWLYANDIAPAAEAKQKPILFHGENRQVKLLVSTANQWSKTDDTDSEIAMAFIPMSIINENHAESVNSVLVLRKLPQNAGPSFTSVDMHKALNLCNMIQICCQHILRIFKATYQAEHLHNLMNRLKETNSPKEAHKYCTETIASIMDAKICTTIEIVRAAQNFYCYVFSSTVYVNEKNKQKYQRAQLVLRNFSFELEINNDIIVLGSVKEELHKKLKAVINQFNQRAQSDAKMNLRELLPVNDYVILAIIDVGKPESTFPTKYAWPLPTPNELGGLVERLKITFDMHLMKSIQKNIQHIKDINSEDAEKLYQASLERLAFLTGADYVVLSFVTEDSRAKMTQYKHSLGESRTIYHNKDIPLKQSLTWPGIISNDGYYIPDITFDEVFTKNKTNYKVLRAVLGQDYQFVKSWSSCPFGYTDQKNEFLGIGAIKLIGLKANEHLSSTSTYITKKFSQFIFQYYREIDKVEALKELNKITNKLSRYSGRSLATNLIDSLENWSLQFLKRQYLISIRASDAFGSLINATSKSIEGHETSIAPNSDNKDPQLIFIGESSYHYHKANIMSLGITELNGELSFLTKASIFKEHRKLINDAAVDISTLICQEHLRQKRARQLTRFKHAIIGPVGAIASSALAIRSIVRETDISRTEDLELFKRSIVSISSEINTINHWTSLSRILGDDNNAQVTMRRHSMSKLIEKCVDRFRDQAAERSIQLTTKSNIKNLEFNFDQFAFDIIVTNLIENAIKYAYYNTDIEIMYGRGWNTFYLVITDIGHGLPENFSEEYREGDHFTWKDPYRIIPGGGYGIAIIESLVKAHKGSFDIVSKPITKIEKDTQRHKVVARVEIPYKV